jgi:hypothetical protein
MTISQKCEKFVTVDTTRSITVDPLECRVRGEVSYITEALTKVLKSPLAITSSNE